MSNVYRIFKMVSDLRSRSILTILKLVAIYRSLKNAQRVASRKLLRIKVTPDLHLTYSKNGGNLGLVLKMKNIALSQFYRQNM